MNQDNAHINELPFEVILIILKNSSFKTIVRLSQTSKRFREICDTPRIRTLIFKKLGQPIPIKSISQDDPVRLGTVFKRTAEQYILPYKSKYIIDCFGRKSASGLVGAKVRRIKYIHGHVAYCGGFEVIKHVCQDPQPCFCQNEWRFVSNENKVEFMLTEKQSFDEVNFSS